MNTWEIESIASVPRFLAAIGQNIPAACTVSFEIQQACPEARAVYARHRSAEKLRPFRDTGFPKTQLYYCVLSAALVEDLEAVLQNHKVKEVFWHVKGFVDFKLLFTIHDADMAGSALLPSHLKEEVVRAIAAAVGQSATVLQTYCNWEADHHPKRS